MHHTTNAQQRDNVLGQKKSYPTPYSISIRNSHSQAGSDLGFFTFTDPDVVTKQLMKIF